MGITRRAKEKLFPCELLTCVIGMLNKAFKKGNGSVRESPGYWILVLCILSLAVTIQSPLFQISIAHLQIEGAERSDLWFTQHKAL